MKDSFDASVDAALLTAATLGREQAISIFEALVAGFREGLEKLQANENGFNQQLVSGSVILGETMIERIEQTIQTIRDAPLPLDSYADPAPEIKTRFDLIG